MPCKVEEWGSTLAKVRRNLGQAYVSYKTKKQMAARAIDNPCRDGCFGKVTQEGVQKNFSEFWALGSYDAQNVYIQNRVEVIPVKRKRTKQEHSNRSNTRQYVQCSVQQRQDQGVQGGVLGYARHWHYAGDHGSA